MLPAAEGTGESGELREREMIGDPRLREDDKNVARG